MWLITTPRSRPSGSHELAFAYFGGVFRLLRYDNLKSAVKKILRRSPAGRDGATDLFSFALGL